LLARRKGKSFILPWPVTRKHLTMADWYHSHPNPIQTPHTINNTAKNIILDSFELNGKKKLKCMCKKHKHSWEKGRFLASNTAIAQTLFPVTIVRCVCAFRKTKFSDISVYSCVNAFWFQMQKCRCHWKLNIWRISFVFCANFHRFTSKKKGMFYIAS